MFHGFLKVAAASPELRVADVEYNVGRIIDMMEDACDMGVRLLVFPELCLTGASCGDLFRQERLIEAAKDGLQDIVDASAGMDMLVFVGLPFEKDGSLYDVTVAVKDGSILGIVPKSRLHLLDELGQSRCFEDGQEVPEIIDTGIFYAPDDFEDEDEEDAYYRECYEEYLREQGLSEEDIQKKLEEYDAGPVDADDLIDAGVFGGDGEDAAFDEENGDGADCIQFSRALSFREDVESDGGADEFAENAEEAFGDDLYDDYEDDFEDDDWDEDFEEFDDLDETIEAPFGANLVLECADCEGLSIAVEMGNEHGLVFPPSAEHASAGAAIIVNPCAVYAAAGAFEKEKTAVAEHSHKLHCAYIRAGAAAGESSTDLVFDACRIIAEDGELLGADASVTVGEGILISDIDYERLAAERKHDRSFVRMEEQDADEDYVYVGFGFFDPEPGELDRRIEKNPFVPVSREKSLCKEVLEIQALGLAKRLAHTHSKRVVLGLSGGLDSTLALLVSLRAAELIGFGPEYVLCLSMPAFGTSEQTHGNLTALAEATGVELREINLKKSLLQHFEDIGHPVDLHDHAFENAQARERTQVLMDIANMEGGLVVGTGDLSESALGWCTYNGDQMSMYAVNADVPKTVIRQILGNLAASTDNAKLAEALRGVLGTPISPELLPTDAEGAIDQKTEDIVGPYELHDFFLYYMLKYGFTPQRIAFLAEHAFAGQYDRETILKWLGTLYTRFFSSQFKRSASVDGPKVFSVDLSPRGELVMPSDAVGELWIREVEILKAIS